MKLSLTLLCLFVLAATAAYAQCKECGCKAKCSPTCECPQQQKTQ
jgi:hypothetical protein